MPRTDSEADPNLSRRTSASLRPHPHSGCAALSHSRRRAAGRSIHGSQSHCRSPATAAGYRRAEPGRTLDRRASGDRVRRRRGVSVSQARSGGAGSLLAATLVAAGAHHRGHHRAADRAGAVVAGNQPAGDARASETGRRVCGKRRRRLDRRVLSGGAHGPRMDVRRRDHGARLRVGRDDHDGHRRRSPRLDRAAPGLDDSQLCRDVRLRHVPRAVDRSCSSPVLARCESSLVSAAGSAGPCLC